MTVVILSTITPNPKIAGSKDARKGLEGQRDCVLDMGEVRDVKGMDVAKVLSVAQYSVKLMEEGEGVSNLDAPRVLRGKLTSALPMEVDGVVVVKAAPKQLVENLGCVSDMVEERGAQLKGAPAVLRVRLVFASLMVEAGDASFQTVVKELKAAPCIARHTVEASDASLKGVTKEPKGVLHFAKDMVEGNGASTKAAEIVQKVSMVELTSVWLMAEESDVLFHAAPRVPEVAQIVVCAMEAASVAYFQVVTKVHKAALISARLMEVGRDVTGLRAVRNLLEVRVVCVLLIAAL